MGPVARRDRRGVERHRGSGARISAPRSAPKRRWPALLTKNGTATGVVLANGDELAADVVISSVDPHLTFLKFMDPRRAARRLRRRRSSLQVPRLVGQGQPRAGRAARLHLPCRGAGPHLRGAISISPSIDYMEQAYDDAKYGRFSTAPVHGHRHSVADRSERRAAGQTRDVVFRAVRALSLEGWHVGRSA